jgi:hypothetical protein
VLCGSGRVALVVLKIPKMDLAFGSQVAGFANPMR